jgi:transposase
LASVPGVSLLVASAFISAIDDPHRFQKASQVSSYLGLCPREESTGGRHKLGSITKQGNAYARSMLVQSAWSIIRSRDTRDSLVLWARKTAERRGRMRAAVAVARRLARILWSLWCNGCYYDRFAKAAGEPLTSATQEPSRKRAGLKLARQQRVNQRILKRAQTMQ